MTGDVLLLGLGGVLYAGNGHPFVFKKLKYSR
jgi:hypothetical protein